MLAIIALIAFIVLSIYSGGEKFRWFGAEIERESVKLAETADEIREKCDGLIKGMKTTEEKIKGLTGKKHEPPR